MSEPQRTQVRVRRSPRISVFLTIGAVIGAIVAIVAVNVTPQDATVPKVQAIGFLILLLAPIGAAITGLIALLLDRLADRRSRIVDAERTVPEAPAAVDPQDATEAPAVDPAEEPGTDPRR